MALKRRPVKSHKPKIKRKRTLDAEDRVGVLEKKAAKKQKKLEYSASIQEARKKCQAIKAAGTITMEDVIRAVNTNDVLPEFKSERLVNLDPSVLLSSLGVGQGVDDFAWSTASEGDGVSDLESGDASDYTDESEDSSDVSAAKIEAGDQIGDEDLDENEDDDNESLSSDSGDDETPVEDQETGQLHKRISFPPSVEFTTESRHLFSSLLNKKDVVVCTEMFHEDTIARSCYLSLSAYALSHMLYNSTRVEKNNKRLRKKGDDFEIPEDSPFRDQGPNRPRICILCPFRSNANEFIRNWILLLNLETSDVGNFENFDAEYTGQDTKNSHSKNWEDWRRELFKGHYDDANYDDFLIGISFYHGKMRIQFPKTAAALCGVDVIIASPIALSKMAASDRKAIRIREKMTIKTQPETEEELMFDADRADGGDNDAETELPIMDFMSSIEVLIVDRVDALTMQNYENCRDVVNAVNEKPVATITADINRIESKFLSVHSAKAARQTVLVAGSIMLGEYQSLLRKDRMETVGDSVYSGASLSRALKLKIKQQFFIRIPVPGQSARNEQLMLYFKNKFWKEIGNEIKNMVIVVADTADFAPLQEFLEDEGLLDCYLAESTLSDIGGKRRKQLKATLKAFRECDMRTIVITERLLWYQRIRITGAKHVLFLGCPKIDSIYADILADVEDPNRCTATCIYTATEKDALERVVGTKNLHKLVVPGARLEEMSGKSTVFTPL